MVAYGKCPDPPRVHAAAIRRELATAGSARRFLVAERGGRLAGYVIVQGAYRDDAGLGLGPYLRPEEWSTPAREALWAKLVATLTEVGAKRLRLYLPAANTAETERLSWLAERRGLKLTEYWHQLDRRC